VKQQIKTAARGMISPLGSAVSRFGVPANAITVAGLGAAILSAFGFLLGHRWFAAGGLLLSGFFDLLDGAVARAGGRPGTRFGAALDSSLDRYGEGLILGAILVHLARQGVGLWLLALAMLAGIGSYLVSYVRARSEGLGISCEVGFLERPERLALLLALSLWGDGGSRWILGLLALFTHVTFIQRLHHLYRNQGSL
jgi:CDP-diacylglycerol---glycerol-3-phosphate 3-phosphatidyltransferase